MTTDRKKYNARRLDRLGVHSLDHVCLQVPDVEAARAFYVAFGLRVDATENGLDVRTHGDDHVWLRLGAGARKRLQHIAFGAFEGDLPGIVARLEACGGEVLERLSPEPDKLVWFHDPNGMLVSISVADKVMPDDKEIRGAAPAGGGLRGAPMRGETPPVHPSRMAHALFFTPSVEKSIEFYSSVLGLKVSDTSGPVAFLHGPHGSDHHLIAFAESAAGIGYHHSAWDVGSVDEVGLGAEQMALAGYRDGWGVGRHVLGSNYFHYVRDPWGSYAEYSFDIDYVPAEMEWRSETVPPENSLYLWGPDVPADFVTNHEQA